MKNTTIPITATIVFSAAVAVLNVVQNEPSRLHANGFQTSGACYTKEDVACTCLVGWHGDGGDGKGGRLDAAKLALQTTAWLCPTPSFKDAKEITAKVGTSDKGLLVIVPCPEPGDKDYSHVAMENGVKVWKPGKGIGAGANRPNKCGTSLQYIARGKPCEEK
jgi:hypothetical protein